jgi:hypothetical protein
MHTNKQLEQLHISLFHDRWVNLFTENDFNALLHQFLVQTKKNIKLENEARASFFLWLSLSCAEKANDEVLLLDLVKTASQLAIVRSDESIQFLLESFIARFYSKNEEIVTNVYFTLSLLAQNNGKVKEAYMYAKLALYFAEKLTKEASMPYLCNARLQYVITKMYGTNLEDVNQVLHEYNWVEGNCFSKEEEMFVQVLELLQQLIQNNVDDEQLEQVVTSLNHSNLVFFPQYLLMQVHYALKKMNETTFGLSFSEEKEVDERQSRYYELLSDRIKIHSELFFEHAQALYRMALEQNETITLLCFEIAKSDIAKIVQFIVGHPKLPFIVHHYDSNKVIIVLKTEDRIELLKALHHSTITVEVVDEVQSSSENRRFPDVYSQFVNKLVNEKSQF